MEAFNTLVDTICRYTCLENKKFCRFREEETKRHKCTIGNVQDTIGRLYIEFAEIKNKFYFLVEEKSDKIYLSASIRPKEIT